jgi:Sulfotransferase family
VTPEASSSYSATAGLPFDDEELESKLVWIWGSPRSGSTWLLEMLCHPFQMEPHSQVGFKWREGWSGTVPALPVNEFQIAAHLAPGIYGDSAEATIADDGGTLMPRTLNRVTDYFASYAFSQAYADVWRPEARRMTLVRVYAVIERAREAGLNIPPQLPLLAIKEVNGSHGADLVMPLFPRSKMIFLVRDGRDVLDSMVDANRPGGWTSKRQWGATGFETDEERLEFVRANAHNWTARMNACSRAYGEHDPELRMRLRYEDLLDDTPARLGELEQWLGLPSGPKRMESIASQHAFDAVPERGRGPGKLRRSATPGAWRDGLTAAEQEVANEIMGETLVELGYER